MKKIFTLLVATALFAGVGFAQETTDPYPTDVTFSSPDGTIQTDPETGESYLSLSQMNTTVNLNLDQAPEIVGVTPVVTIYSGVAGFTEDFITLPVEPVNSNPIVITLDSSMWGNPYMGNYYVTIFLTYIDAEGDYVLRNDEPIIFQMACVTPNQSPAEFLFAYPNGEWEDGDTFAKAYKAHGDGCRFNFNNIVDFDDEELMGEIVYTLKSGASEVLDISMLQENDINEGDAIPAGKATVGYSPLDGNYVVSVYYWNPNIPADDIASIEVSLMDMTSKGVSIEDQSATINNDTTSPEVQKMPKSRLAEGLGANNESVDVFNMQGMLVKANVNKSTIQHLPAGLYIVDGKKVIVR